MDSPTIQSVDTNTASCFCPYAYPQEPDLDLSDVEISEENQVIETVKFKRSESFCMYCSEVFIKKSLKHIYCSKSCKWKAKADRLKVLNNVGKFKKTPVQVTKKKNKKPATNTDLGLVQSKQLLEQDGNSSCQVSPKKNETNQKSSEKGQIQKDEPNTPKTKVIRTKGTNTRNLVYKPIYLSLVYKPIYLSEEERWSSYGKQYEFYIPPDII